uniref:AlNc14C48G3816 protein n=1 Tax=Albugo laibachii Nc14 TaxID=890382 RepID=F0WAV4_9STRA|nr:AlNc14C48G3816 [Albugo laibachii Nc14]CCA18450.1 AlNc14C50G3973 [Albugo laibachii Nc14]|eukprot:CCA18450.1 AlNc14C50G3973 [Albugo laibachii Nc14]
MSGLNLEKKRLFYLSHTEVSVKDILIGEPENVCGNSRTHRINAALSENQLSFRDRSTLGAGLLDPVLQRKLLPGNIPM